ncbi:MAG: HEAT repeat domain-containing protein [Candidatus Eremiobacteraeota bacterium]|nr:HEAT repeat domain-containing protein [Candidatus Eremiobacteraeota bacterium]
MLQRFAEMQNWQSNKLRSGLFDHGISQKIAILLLAIGLDGAARARVPDQELRRIELLERSRHFYHVEALEYGVRSRQWGDKPYDEEMADWVIKEYLLEESWGDKDALLAKVAASPGGLDKLRAASRHVNLQRPMAGAAIGHWLRHSDPMLVDRFPAELSSEFAAKDFRYISEVEFLKPDLHDKTVQGWLNSGDANLVAIGRLTGYLWKTTDLRARELVVSAACDSTLAWDVQNSSLDALLKFVPTQERVDLFEQLVECNPKLALTQNQGLADRFTKPEFIERAIRISQQTSEAGNATLNWLRKLPEKSVEVKRYLLHRFPKDDDLLLEFSADLPETLPRLRQMADQPGPRRYEAALALGCPEKALADLRALLQSQTDYLVKEELVRSIWIAEGAPEEPAIDALLSEKQFGDTDSRRYQLAEALLRHGATPKLRPKLLKLAAETLDDELAYRLYRAARLPDSDYDRWLSELRSGPISSEDLQQLELAVFVRPEILWSFANGDGRTAGVATALLGRPELSARILDSQDDEAIVYLLNYSRSLHRPLPERNLRTLSKRDERYHKMVLHFLESRDDPAGQNLTRELGGLPGARREFSVWLQPLLSEMDRIPHPEFLLAYRGHRYFDQLGTQVVIRKSGTRWELESTLGANKFARELSRLESQDLERWFAIHYSPTAGDIWRPMSHDYYEEVLICTNADRRVLKALNSDCSGSRGLFLRDLCRRMRELGPRGDTW